MTRRRPRAITILALLLGAMLLAVLSLAFLFHLQVERRWKSMERRCIELRADLPRGPGRRPSLRGRSVPGDAREDYKAAIAAAEPFSFADPHVDTLPHPFLDGDPLPEADFQRLLEPVIAPLKRGAGRETFWRLSATDLRPGEEDLDYNYSVVRIAACRARYLGRQGHRREAAELLLDACRFATDLGIPYLLWPPLTALSDLLLEEPLARNDSMEIARELAILEAGMPRRSTEARWMLLLMGERFVESGGVYNPLLYSWGVPETPIEWYFGWSLRLLLADGFLGADRCCEDLERRDTLGWAEACAEWNAPAPTSMLRDNPIPPRFEYIEIPFDLFFRASLAQLRVLRVAAHYRGTGEILNLQDPFGSVIQTRKAGPALRVWSAGNNSPCQLYRFQASEFHSVTFHERPEGANPEIVLEVPP